jgi:hypothetical protein
MKVFNGNPIDLQVLPDGCSSKLRSLDLLGDAVDRFLTVNDCTVVVIGPTGSGKSRLGRILEERNLSVCHLDDVLAGNSSTTWPVLPKSRIYEGVVEYLDWFSDTNSKLYDSSVLFIFLQPSQKLWRLACQHKLAGVIASQAEFSTSQIFDFLSALTRSESEINVIMESKWNMLKEDVPLSANTRRLRFFTRTVGAVIEGWDSGD